jgi:hypothetical protein
MRVPCSILIALSATLLSLSITAQEQDTLPAAPSASRQPAKKPAPTAPKPSTPSEDLTTKQPPPEAASAETSASEKPTARGDSPGAARQSSSSGSTDPDDTAETIRRTVTEVNVVFTVTDKHGRYVKDLKKNDFTVVDDNRPAQEIRSFHTETDLPMRDGL